MLQAGKLFAALSCIAVALFTASANAQHGDRGGSDVTILVGFAPGTNYDAWGRVIGRHIKKHLPGSPTIVIQNMPGAGSFSAANRLFNNSPKDGTIFGLIARDAPLGPLTGAEGARFDATKFSWLGTPTLETNVCVAMSKPAVKVKRVEDLLQHELIIGSTGAGTGTNLYPKVLSGLLGLKFKQITGFPASSDILLAMERGEVDGVCDSLDNIANKRPDWITEKKINILFQGPASTERSVPDVPSVLQLARTADEKSAIQFLYAGQALGRPFVAPPDLPPATLKALRAAFAATMKDPEFIADVESQKLFLAPSPGEELEAVIKQTYATPKTVIEKIGALAK